MIGDMLDHSFIIYSEYDDLYTASIVIRYKWEINDQWWYSMKHYTYEAWEKYKK